MGGYPPTAAMKYAWPLNYDSYFVLRSKHKNTYYIIIKKKINMPQLTPFYYMNEIVFAFAIIVVLLFILSKYILPRIVRLFLSRMFINKI